ncbi:putative Cullin family [Trypanosoma vivax]|nr:putative Cullin family [Trypanosoma vivax]
MSRSQNNDYISEDVKKAYSLPLFALKFEFNPLWLAVNSTCNSILNWNLSHEFRGQRIFLEIVRAYTIVYRLVSAPCSECPKLMAGSTSQHNVVGNTDEGTQALVVYHLLRDVIRKHLTSTVLRHLENSILLPCPELLERYLSEWKVFITAVNMLKVVFSYLHGPWQKYDIPVDHHMLPTEVVALINWNEYVMTQKIRERLSTQIFELIERATSTQNDDYDLLVREIGQALSMLSDLRHNSYVTIIEEKYLFKISEFYKKEVHVLKARGVVEYIESVLGILKKESDYAIRLLKRSSLQAVVQRVADVLIDEQLSFLSQYMASWIMEDNTIQLTKLYSLLTKSSSGLNELRQVFKKCVCDRGMKDVSTACEEALNSNKDVYRVALEKLISVYRHFVSVKHAFAMDDGIEEAIYSGLSNVTSSCIYLKNHDLLGDELARFAHFELLKNEELFESRAHDIVTLYRLLPAIHAFLASYPKYLSNRLLSDYYHVDHEKLIIEKILQTRTSTGDFARKCGLMLIDVTETSRVLSEKFNMSRTHTGQHTQMDFSALVLTSYSWPDFLRDTSQPIPMSIREDLRDFQEFYSKSCPMRHITFIHRFSRGVLKFTCYWARLFPR